MSDHMVTCFNCGASVHEEDAFLTDEGLQCDECGADDLREAIRDYHASRLEAAAEALRNIADDVRTAAKDRA